MVDFKLKSWWIIEGPWCFEAHISFIKYLKLRFTLHIKHTEYQNYLLYQWMMVLHDFMQCTFYTYIRTYIPWIHRMYVGFWSSVMWCLFRWDVVQKQLLFTLWTVWHLPKHLVKCVGCNMKAGSTCNLWHLPVHFVKWMVL
jgi:hypothetical protein